VPHFKCAIDLEGWNRGGERSGGVRKWNSFPTTSTSLGNYILLDILFGINDRQECQDVLLNGRGAATAL
jgi:hypothetical protein